MAETIEKIYCCDGNNNSDAVLNGFLAGRGCNDGNNNWWPMAAMMGGGFGNQWNNPFIYLVWMMFAQRMWGANGFGVGNAVQTAEIQAQINSLREQINNNQNSNLILDAIKGNGCDLKALATQLNCDFNALQGAICDVRGGIDKLAGQVGFSAERVINAVQMGNANLTQVLQNCCCETQKQILAMQGDFNLQICRQTNELRNGQRDLGVAIAQGFSQVGYQAQQDKCEILRAGELNTQRIVDTLQNHWKDEQAREIQDLKFQLSQERQNNYFARLVNGCGCGNSCGCGNGCGC